MLIWNRTGSSLVHRRVIDLPEYKNAPFVALPAKSVAVSTNFVSKLNRYSNRDRESYPQAGRLFFLALFCIS